VHLAEHEVLLVRRHQVDDAVGDDAVGDAVLQGHRGNDALDEGDIVGGGAARGFDGVSAREHVVVHVDADGAAGGAEFGRGEEDVEAGAGAEVEDGFALGGGLVRGRAGVGDGEGTSRRLVIARGLPQLRPRLASSGMLASSSWE